MARDSASPWTRLLLLLGAIIGARAQLDDAEAALFESQRVPLTPYSWNGTRYGCRTYPGDRTWPSRASWATLNSTVGGNLIVDIPPGAPCYNTFEGPLGTVKTYNAAQCADAQANFNSPNEQWSIEKPAAELWTYFTNDTCRPTANANDSCTLGYYGVYVILAKSNDHIKAGLDFARTNNLRLIVRNTGHDFLGRSTGWGALVINTHSFQSVEWTASWTGPGGYNGSAVTVGAGVQAGALLGLAHAQSPPKTLVFGECATVGAAGGLVQGGGHGPLTTLYGLTADNALEFNVLTASGSYLTANARNNSDLFWALKGGGPASYAIILSATYKTYTDLPSAGIILNINSTHTNDSALFWKGVTAFNKYQNRYVDNGLYVYYELGFGGNNLHIQPFVGVGKTAAQTQAVIQPFLDELHSIGLNYSSVTKSYATFYDLYIDLFEGELAGNSGLTGGWMFSHSDVESNNDGIVASYQTALGAGALLVGHTWSAGHGLPSTAWNLSSAHPRFRVGSTKIISVLGLAGNAPLADKAAAQDTLTNVVDGAMRKAGPGGCAYVNEADPYQPNWQTNFWGDNYPKLAALRKKWDPSGVFYAVSTPGTEAWEVIEYGTRLCKKI